MLKKKCFLGLSLKLLREEKRTNFVFSLELKNINSDFTMLLVIFFFYTHIRSIICNMLYEYNIINEMIRKKKMNYLHSIAHR